MVKIKDIINALEAVAPLSWQEDYDNAGLVLGNKNVQCSGVMICLDVFSTTIRQAINKHCNLVVSHHPVIFHGIKKIDSGSELEKVLQLALKNDIAIYCTHTNMDAAIGGVNSVLAEKLGLHTIKAIDKSRFQQEANYLGEGAFGKLEQKLYARDYLNSVKQALGLKAIRYVGDIDKDIEVVGFCGGSGSFLIGKAIEKGCQIFLTGDIKYHDFLSAENKIILADIGHFESEQFIKEKIKEIISEKIRNFAPLYITEDINRVKFL